MLSEAKVALSVAARYVNALSLSTVSSDLQFPRTVSFGPGVAANQADVAWSARRTIAAATNDDLDLVGGSFTDPFGVAINFAKVRALVVVADAANGSDVVIGAAAGAPWLGPFGGAAHTAAVPPGGQFVAVNPSLAGWPAVAATSDLLRLRNNGGALVAYEIVIIGASA